MLQVNGDVVDNSALTSLKIVLLSVEKRYNPEEDSDEVVGGPFEHLDCTACSTGY
jgi:hypothetical protein